MPRPPATSRLTSRCSSGPGSTPSTGAIRRSSNRILADDFEGIDQAGKTFKKAAVLRDPLVGAFVTDSYAELEQVKTRRLRRHGRRHQPVQGPRFRGPRVDDARLCPATRPMAVRRLACELGVRRRLPGRWADRRAEPQLGRIRGPRGHPVPWPAIASPATQRHIRPLAPLSWFLRRSSRGISPAVAVVGDLDDVSDLVEAHGQDHRLALHLAGRAAPVPPLAHLLEGVHDARARLDDLGQLRRRVAESSGETAQHDRGR